MMSCYKLCTLIFSFLFDSLSYFFNAAQDLFNGLHNSLTGHNAQFETRCPRGFTIILLLGFTTRTTEQSNQL